jgi:Ni2+-binding GTPase involved in maturation of urease and hydrogenase
MGSELWIKKERIFVKQKKKTIESGKSRAGCHDDDSGYYQASQNLREWTE